MVARGARCNRFATEKVKSRNEAVIVMRGRGNFFPSPAPHPFSNLFVCRLWREARQRRPTKRWHCFWSAAIPLPLFFRPVTDARGSDGIRVAGASCSGAGLPWERRAPAWREASWCGVPTLAGAVALRKHRLKAELRTWHFSRPRASAEDHS